MISKKYFESITKAKLFKNVDDWFNEHNLVFLKLINDLYSTTC